MPEETAAEPGGEGMGARALGARQLLCASPALPWIRYSPDPTLSTPLRLSAGGWAAPDSGLAWVGMPEGPPGTLVQRGCGGSFLQRWSGSARASRVCEEPGSAERRGWEAHSPERRLCTGACRDSGPSEKLGVASCGRVFHRPNSILEAAVSDRELWGLAGSSLRGIGADATCRWWISSLIALRKSCSG